MDRNNLKPTTVEYEPTGERAPGQRPDGAGNYPTPAPPKPQRGVIPPSSPPAGHGVRRGH